MPGLQLTLAQAGPLLGLPEPTPGWVLERLIKDGFLDRNPGGAYRVATAVCERSSVKHEQGHAGAPKQSRFSRNSFRRFVTEFATVASEEGAHIVGLYGMSPRDEADLGRGRPMTADGSTPARAKLAHAGVAARLTELLAIGLHDQRVVKKVWRACATEHSRQLDLSSGRRQEIETADDESTPSFMSSTVRAN
jgi:hypothetical protein